jgi:hypothetical protein
MKNVVPIQAPITEKILQYNKLDLVFQLKVKIRIRKYFVFFRSFKYWKYICERILVRSKFIYVLIYTYSTLIIVVFFFCSAGAGCRYPV